MTSNSVSVSITTSVTRRQPAPALDVPLLPLNDYRAWQQTVVAQNANVYRLRKWGDPILVEEGGLSTDLIDRTNFQAVGLYNRETGFGGVSNHLTMQRADIDYLAGLQVEDEYIAKVDDWLDQKMRWLYKPRGTIYFGEGEGEWDTIASILWGTIALGGNLVWVEGVETIKTALPSDSRKFNRQMARLRGFRKTDRSKPLAELLTLGLVHRCFGAYRGSGGANGFGDSPKGIVYSPFYSPLDWKFAGNDRPQAFYLPFNWLEAK